MIKEVKNITNNEEYVRMKIYDGELAYQKPNSQHSFVHHERLLKR